MPYYPKDEFKKLAEEIKSSGHPHRLTVRELLHYYHQDRRGQSAVRWIRSNLSELGLECNPDLDGVFLDGQVELRKKPTVKSQKANAPDTEATLKPDPVQRLTLLPAANRPPVTIHRDADLQRAITLMLMHDYSQLPVMQIERDVDVLPRGFQGSADERVHHRLLERRHQVLHRGRHLTARRVGMREAFALGQSPHG